MRFYSLKHYHSRQMICASIHLMVLLSGRTVNFMPTGLLLYGWNLICCDTIFMMLPQAVVITTLFLYSVGLS